MSSVAVVYWSGTGNTEIMARAVANAAGADLIKAKDFNSERAAGYDAMAFGCPAMGDEVLEEDEFEPMFASVERKLSGKTVVLFGSYDWGDGEWMRQWEARCQAAGAKVLGTVIAQLEPDAEASAALKGLGGRLAQA